MKQYVKRCLALALSFAMMAAPSSPVEAAGNEVRTAASEEKWVEFDFNTAAVGNKFTSGDVEAVISGGATKPVLQDREGEGKALYLDGSASWLSLQKKDGTSLLTGLNELTVSFDAKPDRTATNWGFYAAPNAEKQNNGKEHYIGALINGGKTKIERYNNTNGRPACAEAATGTDWSHVDVVFTEDATTIYVDGARKSSVKSDYKLTDILGNASIFYIGKANWGNGEYYKGWIDNFVVYGRALGITDICTPEEIQRMIRADEEALNIDVDLGQVKKDFGLPAEGGNGSGITWTAEPNGCIQIEGNTAKVTRPEGADQTVKLTAELSLGGIKSTKVFSATVIKKLGYQEIVANALEYLVIPNADDIRDNITLPAAVQAPDEDGVVSVSWESKNKDVVTDTKSGKQEPGMVKRPARDTDVELVATGTLTVKPDGGGQTETYTAQRSIKVTVKAKKEIGKMTSYLFAHFTGTEGRATDEQIYFATSEDGSQWMDMTANGQPALTSDIGDRGVRDPYLIRSCNGDKYYLIATDLSIYHRGGWGNAQATTNGSTKLVVWESTDLVNWSEPRLVDVASRIPGAGCAWAPEAYYDPDTGNYVVYWATASDESNNLGDRMNMYYCTTRDFYTFTEPVLWIDRQNSIIDTTMIYDDSTQTYYRASGDGQITIEKSKSIYEGWEIIGTLSSIFNDNNYSGAKLEGPEFFEYCEDDWLKDANGNPVRTWGLMCDQYSAGKGYLPFRSTNLGDMTTASWSPASDVNFGSLKKRHGTILPVTDAEYKAVMDHFGYGEGGDAEQKVLAEFDFNKEESYGDGSKGFTSENAKAAGNFTLQDNSNDAAQGKALYLNGTSDFLTVTDKEGGSLLSGSKELTISYEFKPDRSDKANWLLYAAPASGAPTYKSERYLGILENGGSTALERYNNSGERPQNPQVQTGSGWSRVDIVLTETDTVMYLNGRKMTTAGSNYKIPNILGNSGILQIGKADWGSGEYCKGWIDNFRIENKALSESEVQTLAAGFVNKLPVEVSAAVVGTVPDRDTALTYRGTDDHTAITSVIDAAKKEIQPYVRRNANVKDIPASFTLNGPVDKIEVGGKVFTNGSKLDLSADAEVVFTRGDKSAVWKLKKAIVSNNPVLPGQYADPDIDYFDGKFWIFPTTDGFPSWSGTVFHAFSSEDMVNWTDHGIIMELANDNPGKNENGVQIAKSPWAVKGSAWAPTIEKKNGKYYFYYCGKESSGASAIGVAVADNPEGPYADKGIALITKKMSDDAGAPVGQAIDPSIFTDDDGTSYILYGNGKPAIAELNDDMMSIKSGTMKPIGGLTDFRESVVVTKVDGIYHWTWTCDDANSPNYHVNYGVSDKLIGDDGTVSVTLKKKNLLSKDEGKGILGSGHQSVVHVKDRRGKDRYFMAYHRFYTPLNIFVSGDGLGKHRETCIDEITFDGNGQMVIEPTLEGVSAWGEPIEVNSIRLDKAGITLAPKKTFTLKATVEPEDADDKTITWKSDNTKVATVSQTGVVTAVKAGTAKITAEAGGKTAACTVTVKIAVAKAALSTSKVTLGGGEKYTLKAVITPRNATNKKAVWKSSNPKAAAVSQTGVVTAKKVKKKATAKITVQVDGKTSKACTVTVKPAPTKKTKVTLNKKSVTLKRSGKNKTFQIKPKVSSKFGSASFIYSVDKKGKKYVAVDKKGKVAAKKKGKAVITVKTFNGKAKTTLKVTVK